jgi:hypothetical protein
MASSYHLRFAAAVLISYVPLGCSDSETSAGGGAGGAITTTPTPSGFTGDLLDGEDFAITGEGFGSKEPVEPWIWDTFEAGAAAEEIQGWQLWNDDGFPSPQYTDVECATGARCAALNFEDHQAHNALLAYHDELHEQMYGAIRYKVVKTGGFDSRNIKLFRLMGTMAGDPVHGTPVIAWGGMDSSSMLDPSDPGPWDEQSTWMTAASGSATCSGPSRMYGSSPRDEWHALSQWIGVSIPDGAENGVLGRRINSDFKQEQDVTKCADSTSDGLDEVAIGLYLAHDRDVDDDGDGQGDGWEYVESDYMIYVDDVYVDITLARVEICTSAVWEDGSCQVQIPHTTWNDTTIELTAHQGALPAGDTLYLFVVSPSGLVSSPIEVRFD